jgi:hypothetical protein
MNIVYALILIGASLAASGQSELSKQTEAANPPFELEITANLDKEHSNVWDFVNSAETTVKTGSMVVVAIRKTNITDHVISKLTNAGAHSSYYIDVRDSNGNLVGLRKPNEVRMIGDDHGGHSSGTMDSALHPGEHMIDHDLVGRWLDMSAPGTYTIQVSAHISNDPKSDVVKSNIITVTVQEPDPPADAPQ